MNRHTSTKKKDDTMSTYIETSKKVICTYSGSSWYKVGKEYTVYKHINNPKAKFVRASDGFFDNISASLSEFKPK